MITKDEPIVIASANKNKIAELKTVAKEFDIHLLAPDEVDVPGPIPEVEEIGESYLENARLKAVAFARWSGTVSLGDDSGLEVDALEGRPGLYSARYGGEGLSDSERCMLLLNELSDQLTKNPQLTRVAQYCCTLVLSNSDGEELISQASIPGRIIEKPRGDGGFGYDPIVLIDELDRTFAEVDFELTCRKGFRGSAARKLFAKLQ